MSADASPPLPTPPASAPRLGAAPALTALWGVGGVLLLLGQATWRLTHHALVALRHPALTPLQLLVLVAWIVVCGYAEGYRAFQQRFSPRVVARALHLAQHRAPLHLALAPLFCMGFFHARRRVLGVAWGTTLMVVIFILVLQRVPQPWRGIVDSGVVLALAWGTLSIVVHLLRGLAGRSVPSSAELPEEAPATSRHQGLP